MLNWLKIILGKFICFKIVRRIVNEAQLYEGPLKTIEKGFKPFKWFQKEYNDSTAEIMKIRTGFKNITIIKFDMSKLYDAAAAGDAGPGCNSTPSGYSAAASRTAAGTNLLPGNRPFQIAIQRRTGFDRQFP